MIVLAACIVSYIIWRFAEAVTGQGYDAEFSRAKNFFRFRLSPFVSGVYQQDAGCAGLWECGSNIMAYVLPGHAVVITDGQFFLCDTSKQANACLRLRVLVPHATSAVLSAHQHP